MRRKGRKVIKPAGSELMDYPSLLTHIHRNRSFRAAEIQTSEKPKSRVLKNRSLDLGKSEVKTSEKPSVIRLIRIILS